MSMVLVDILATVKDTYRSRGSSHRFFNAEISLTIWVSVLCVYETFLVFLLAAFDPHSHVNL